MRNECEFDPSLRKLSIQEIVRSLGIGAILKVG
jgi:hypothetical protein